MNQEKIGKFILKLRKEKHLTQEQLAKKLNVTDRAVSHWENGRSMPDVSLFKPICEIFNISLNELLSGEKIKSSELKEKSDILLHQTLEYSNKKIGRIKKIIIIIIICLIITLFLVSFLVDYKRIRSNTNPLFMVMIKEDGNKYLYLGPGYKMIKYSSISPFEPLNHSQQIKFGLWFFTWEVNVLNPKPYNLWVINKQERVLTNIGSYCITDIKEDLSASECALGIPPTDMTYQNILSGKVGDIIAIDSESINLTRISIYKLTGEEVKIDIEHDSKNFTLPYINGEYIIKLDTISNRGTTWYTFKMRVS